MQISEKNYLCSREYNINTVIVNGENSADGNGITPVTAKYLLDSGADCVTTGNHCFRRKEMDAFYETSDIVIRPANFPDEVVGKGYTILDRGRCSICVINLMGVVFMQNLENPFNCIDRILNEVKSKVIIVDFHAEATSEKERSVTILPVGFLLCLVLTLTFRQPMKRFSAVIQDISLMSA